MDLLVTWAGAVLLDAFHTLPHQQVGHGLVPAVIEYELSILLS
jgi:hypothetical protein